MAMIMNIPLSQLPWIIVSRISKQRANENLKKNPQASTRPLITIVFCPESQHQGLLLVHCFISFPGYLVSSGLLRLFRYFDLALYMAMLNRLHLSL